MYIHFVLIYQIITIIKTAIETTTQPHKRTHNHHQ